MCISQSTPIEILLCIYMPQIHKITPYFIILQADALRIFRPRLDRATPLKAYGYWMSGNGCEFGVTDIIPVICADVPTFSAPHIVIIFAILYQPRTHINLKPQTHMHMTWPRSNRKILSGLKHETVAVFRTYSYHTHTLLTVLASRRNDIHPPPAIMTVLCMCEEHREKAWKLSQITRHQFFSGSQCHASKNAWTNICLLNCSKNIILWKSMECVEDVLATRTHTHTQAVFLIKAIFQTTLLMMCFACTVYIYTSVASWPIQRHPHIVWCAI